MMKRLTIILAGFTVLALAACQDHFTTQEAYDVCEGLTESITTAAGEEIFAQCVACYEECGEDCEQTGDAEAAFACPN